MIFYTATHVRPAQRTCFAFASTSTRVKFALKLRSVGQNVRYCAICMANRGTAIAPKRWRCLALYSECIVGDAACPRSRKCPILFTYSVETLGDFLYARHGIWELFAKQCARRAVLGSCHSCLYAFFAPDVSGIAVAEPENLQI